MLAPTHAKTDAVLVREAQSGNATAFDELIARHYSMVYAIALSRLREVEAAEDLTQEVFLRTYLNLKALKDGGRYMAWVSRMTRNLATDWQRRGITRSSLIQMVPFGDHTDTVPDPSQPDVRDAIMDEQEKGLMREALWKLTPLQRELVLMHFQEGMSKKEIANRVGLHPSNVGRQIDKAIEAMREDVEDAVRVSLRPQRSTPRLARQSAAVVAGVMLLTPEAKAALVTAAAKTATVKTGADVAAGSFSLAGLLQSISGTLTAGASIMGTTKIVAATVIVAAAVGGGVMYNHSKANATASMPNVGQRVENKISREQFLADIPPANFHEFKITPQTRNQFTLEFGSAVALDFSSINDVLFDMEEIVIKPVPDGKSVLLCMTDRNGNTFVAQDEPFDKSMEVVHYEPELSDKIEYIHATQVDTGIHIYYQMMSSPELKQSAEEVISAFRRGEKRSSDVATDIVAMADRYGITPPDAAEQELFRKALHRRISEMK